MPNRNIKRGHKHCKNSFCSAMTETNKRSHKAKKLLQASEAEEQEVVAYWRAIKSIFSCKFHRGRKAARMRSMWCAKSSLCHSIKDSNASVVIRPRVFEQEAEKKSALVSSCNTSSRSLRPPIMNEMNGGNSFSSNSSAAITVSSLSSSFSSLGGSFRKSMHQRRISGCYECQIIDDSTNLLCRDPCMRSGIVSPCTECGEIFMKPEALELHQSMSHAVSQLGSEDSSRSIIEIIFQSSWLKKQAPQCKIDRILKVNNSQKTITRFEDYRDSVKSAASKLSKKHPRCIADGNELLRFYSTTFSCSLGFNGSTNLCQMIPNCSVCSIIRDGLKVDEKGRIRTMSTSGRAHDVAQISSDEKRAMLVCRVIAGRVKRSQDDAEEHDSVFDSEGTHSNVDELFVFNPKALLACFVVIYSSV